jgi:hypothetical protein
MFFVTPLGGGLAFWTESLPVRRIHHVIQHEGFHQFAYSRFGTDLPIWVNEGLAEFFGQAVLIGRTLIIGQSNPRAIEHVKEAIELETYTPFRTMLDMDTERWNSAVRDGNASLRYEQSWSMVHFLVYGDGGRYQAAFEHYLRLINNGHTSYTAFVKAFGGDDVEAFERRWIEYARRAKPSAFVTAMERIEFLAEGALALNKQKMHAESLDDVRAKLREIGFTYTLDRHAIDVTLSAEDDALFEIPMDELAREQPVFVGEQLNVHRLPLRDRRLEELNPTPLLIRTEHLEPRNLRIDWQRDRETNMFMYDIVVR